MITDVTRNIFKQKLYRLGYDKNIKLETVLGFLRYSKKYEFLWPVKYRGLELGKVNPSTVAYANKDLFHKIMKDFLATLEDMPVPLPQTPPTVAYKDYDIMGYIGDRVVLAKDLSCHICGYCEGCEYAYDLDNTDGDCLALK